METPTIVYIDDDEKDARRVMFELDQQFEAEFVKPEEDPINLIDKIFSYRPDAIIVDFRLSELNPEIHYDGFKVVQYVLERKENFPIFLLTSHQDDAFIEVDDVNVVYEKGELFSENSTFLVRVANQIVKYKKRLEEGEKQLLHLLEKKRLDSLSLTEERELIRLDGFIEKSLEKNGAVPDELKVISNEKKVFDILTEVNVLIEKVNEKLSK